MKPLLNGLVLGTLLFIPCASFAQRNLTDIPDPDPELERRTFQVADGFDVQLFAADPLLAKPIQMNFDPAGRLWVATSETYPHITPGQRANDKIIILTDRDGDGRADDTQIFADGLLIPTGIEPGDGGCYVGASTELLHLRDTDGDDRADVTRVVLSGFGTEDTHHIIHTLRWGPEGSLYFNQSIYIHSHVETPYGVERLNGGGIWRLKPPSSRLEVYARGMVNPWGFQFDRFGQSFATDGAGSGGIHYVFPGVVFPTSPGARRVMQGLNPGSPKFCGLEIVDGRHLPDDWQGDLITHDFRGHRVCRFKLADAGSSYASRELPELIKTNHVAFRPVDVKLGPDGAIYIADWYNPIIQHGEVDFRDPRRDHVHGRIWRVSRKDRPPVVPPRLVDADEGSLLDALSLPESWTRQQARRVLFERDPDQVCSALEPRLAAARAATPRDDRLLLEYQWVLQGLGRPERGPLPELLTSSDFRCRAAALRIISEIDDPDFQNQVGLAPLRLALDDSAPRVRLEALRGIARRGWLDGLASLGHLLRQPLDESLDFAVWLTTREMAPRWLPGCIAGEFNFEGDVRALTLALSAAESPQAAPALNALLSQHRFPPQDHPALADLVGRLGGPDEVARFTTRVLSWIDQHPRDGAASLLALAAASGPRGVVPPGDGSAIIAQINSTQEDVAQGAVVLSGTWKLTGAVDRLAQLAREASASETLRLAAIDALGQIGGPAGIDVLRSIVEQPPLSSASLRALARLVRLDARWAAERCSTLFQAETNLDPAPVIEAFLEQKEGADTLATALKEAHWPADTAKRAVRAATATARPVTALVEALRRAGGITGANRVWSQAEVSQLIQEVTERGDPVRGEAVYRRSEHACQKCHALGGAGGQVGPDLSSLGGSAQLDYLVESLLEPSKKIKENYHSLIVQMTDGRIITGVKVRQSDRDLILRNAEDAEVVIPLAMIDDQAPGQSLMPVGLADNLTRAELVDLVRFLAALGKVGEYSVGRERVVRRWQLLEPNAAARERLRRDRVAAAATQDAGLTWLPVYSTVAGSLPLAELPSMEQTWQGLVTLPKITVLRAEMQVSVPGKIALAMAPARGLSLWVDGQPQEIAERVELDLSTGRHRLTWVVDRNVRHEPLRVEWLDVAGSAAQGQFVGGK